MFGTCLQGEWGASHATEDDATPEATVETTAQVAGQPPLGTANPFAGFTFEQNVASAGYDNPVHAGGFTFEIMAPAPATNLFDFSNTFDATSSVTASFTNAGFIFGTSNGIEGGGSGAPSGSGNDDDNNDSTNTGNSKGTENSSQDGGNQMPTLEQAVDVELDTRETRDGEDGDGVQFGAGPQSPSTNDDDDDDDDDGMLDTGNLGGSGTVITTFGDINDGDQILVLIDGVWRRALISRITRRGSICFTLEDGTKGTTLDVKEVRKL